MEALLTAATQTGSPPKMPSPSSEGSAAEASFHELVSELMPSASNASVSSEAPKSMHHIGKDQKGEEQEEARKSKEDPPSAAIPIVLVPPQRQLTPCQELVVPCVPSAVTVDTIIDPHDEKRSEPAMAETTASDDRQPSAETENSVHVLGSRAQPEPEIPAGETAPQTSPVPSGNDFNEAIIRPIEDAASTRQQMVTEVSMAEPLPPVSDKPSERATEPLSSVLTAQRQHGEQLISTNLNFQPSDSASKKVEKNSDNSQTVHVAPAASQAVIVKENSRTQETATQIDATSVRPPTSALNEPYPPHSSTELISQSSAIHERLNSDSNVVQSRSESIPQIQSADLQHRASNSELKVELKIAELGRVQVSASLHDENVHALVKVENSDARTVIAGEIGRADCAVNRHEIKVQTFGASSSADNNNAQQQSRQPQTSARSYFPQSHAWKSTNPSITNVSSRRPVSDRGLDLLA